jgi:hypothetical protein
MHRQVQPVCVYVYKKIRGERRREEKCESERGRERHCTELALILITYNL